MPAGRTQEGRPRAQSVLVVEDEYLVAMDLSSLLTTNGWRVLGPAATVAESLEILRTEQPDVAVLDISLRERELVTPVAQALRDLNIPFVITSAYRAGHFRSEILDDAPQVGKPTDGGQLLLSLKELTAGARGLGD